MRGDHPRSRGEYTPSISAFNNALGSSPLSRGIRSGDANWNAVKGIIPALAGNTAGQPAPCLGARDHPRSRGEYENSQPRRDRIRGSSPLSRGILFQFNMDGDHNRIIPALAGNTHPRFLQQGRIRDHPRSRGEYSFEFIFVILTPGSSPLSRGIRLVYDAVLAREGIIPALAGNTIDGQRLRGGPRDHPRSRGEYTISSPPSTALRGSSPLSRGIRMTCFCGTLNRGIIPALAGNTVIGVPDIISL